MLDTALAPCFFWRKDQADCASDARVPEGSAAPLWRLQASQVLYAVRLEQPLTKEEAQAFFSILNIAQTQNADALSEALEAGQLWVAPRLGTVSPWSSQVLTLLHSTGLTKVKRIEALRCYRFKADGDASPEALNETWQGLVARMHDPLTESVLLDAAAFLSIFDEPVAKPACSVPVLAEGAEALVRMNREQGWGLSSEELAYIAAYAKKSGRNPTDVELMMFAQVNSEHCRHKRFNAAYSINGHVQKASLFDMIRNTYRCNPQHVIVAYKDNAAILKGPQVQRLTRGADRRYAWAQGMQPTVFKVETHNHPTAIAPEPGAATGQGGEIRDEAATGRGACTVAACAGFSVSHLHLPGHPEVGGLLPSDPPHSASALRIMLEAPVGAARYNNEFGRPTLCGYFRSFQAALKTDYGVMHYGYHKPIMLAGGIGFMREGHTEKKALPVGAKIIVLGGPGLPIGLGGGAASSKRADAHATDEGVQQALDFASVQRANPEMEQRTQRVLDALTELGDANPILSIHDVGAGGLSNAIPEIVHDAGRGALIDLRAIPSDAPGMTPLEIWCNESQERYVMVMEEDALTLLEAAASRERCPYAVVGTVTSSQQLRVHDPLHGDTPIDLPLPWLLDCTPRLCIQAQAVAWKHTAFSTQNLVLSEALSRVLRHPTVADKSFLITIGDRSVGGLVTRDPMVGPWQVPVSDVAVVAQDFHGDAGQALAMGERAPIALLHHAASARMAVAEAITNLLAADITALSEVCLSANWMADADYPGESKGLYDAVRAIAMDFCPELGIAIPVGKDSLSMRMQWKDTDKQGVHHQVTSPLSLVITATAPVRAAHRTLTPYLNPACKASTLLFVDLGGGVQAMGGSILAACYEQLGSQPADCQNPERLARFAAVMRALRDKHWVHAYHDRSDGGLIVTLCEMAFASHTGLNIDISSLGSDPFKILFNEELGAVLQIERAQRAQVLAVFAEHGLADLVHTVAEPTEDHLLTCMHRGKLLLQESRVSLHQAWSSVSAKMMHLRDNPAAVDTAFAALQDEHDPGLHVHLPSRPLCPLPDAGAAPRVRAAVLREEGVNGFKEMAAALMLAGFEAVDVTMTDLIQNPTLLEGFDFMAACGGFSYGDALGAGRGWAQAVLQNKRLRASFKAFFHHPKKWVLGVCNGCQFLSHLKSLMPGAGHFPSFRQNASQQFEGRLVQVEVQDSPSLLLKNLQGARLPLVVAHGEGRIDLKADGLSLSDVAPFAALRYVDHRAQPDPAYPFNPNGSDEGITGVCNEDGRITLMMPHPERVFLTQQCSWFPPTDARFSPWMQLFLQAAEGLALR